MLVGARQPSELEQELATAHGETTRKRLAFTRTVLATIVVVGTLTGLAWTAIWVPFNQPADLATVATALLGSAFLAVPVGVAIGWLIPVRSRLG
jgi:hypothetical protein